MHVRIHPRCGLGGCLVPKVLGLLQQRASQHDHSCALVPDFVVLSLASSTSSLATWWSTLIFFSMVAPSFVIVMSPSGETIILSMPLGPSEVLIMDATALAARMWAFWASNPLRRFFFSCSRTMMNGRPCSSNTRLILVDRSNGVGLHRAL